MTQINPTPDGYDLMIYKPLPGTDAKILALHSRHKTLEEAIKARDKLAGANLEPQRKAESNRG